MEQGPRAAVERPVFSPCLRTWAKKALTVSSPEIHQSLPAPSPESDLSVEPRMSTSSRYATFFHIHLVSDSTGETLNAMARAVCARFQQAAQAKEAVASSWATLLGGPPDLEPIGRAIRVCLRKVRGRPRR